MTPPHDPRETPDETDPQQDRLDPASYDAFLRRALEEDRATDDVTRAALVPADRSAVAELTVKAPGVICGLDLAAPVFHCLDPDARVTLLAGDGDTVGAGTVVLRVAGRAGAILSAERTVLNVLQRLSGVATRTAAFVEATLATGAEIFDTRKTTPGWRALEKYAVRCGGGRNHRMDLADAAMVKENHLRAAYGRTGPDSIAEAVRTLLTSLPAGVTIFVEVEDRDELEAAVQAAGADAGRLVVMLDDFEIGPIRQAVRWLHGTPGPRPVLEVTGGVTLEHVAALAATGVRRLSTGSLTHSAPALDMALKIVDAP